MMPEAAGYPRSPVGVGYLIDDLGSGGAQRQLVELVCRLDRRLFAPQVYYYREPCFHASALDAAQVPVHRIHKRPGFDPRVTAALVRGARAEGLLILHGFLPGPNLYCALAARLLPRCTAIASERSNRPDQPLSLSALEAAGYHLARHVVANSFGGATRLSRRYRVGTRKVSVIPNGVDTERFARAGHWRVPARRELEIADDERLLLMVGRPSPEKNHALVLEALAQSAPHLTRPWRLLVVGGEPDGATGRALQDYIRRSGLGAQVRFLAPRADIERYYAACDCLLLASRYEGCPNVVMEAAASGRPVLASRVGDVAHLVQDGISGLLFPADDREALARALLRLDGLSDAALHAMGEAGMALMQAQYGMARMVSRSMELYDALLGTGRARLSHGQEQT